MVRELEPVHPYLHEQKQVERVLEYRDVSDLQLAQHIKADIGAVDELTTRPAQPLTLRPHQPAELAGGGIGAHSSPWNIG